jgi:murein DD-endopeptidase MepM/ murein hydrolase activator NlpD
MHDRRSSRRHNRWRWVRIILAAALLMPIVAVQAPVIPVIPVRADDLSDAVAQRQKLDKLVAVQKKQLADLSASQAALQTTIASTRQNLEAINGSMDELQGEMTTLQAQVDQVQASYDSLVAQQNQLVAQLGDLAAQAQAKQDQLIGRQKILAGRLVAAYQTDQTPLLAQLLTAHSLTDILSDVSYYMDLGLQDKALADQIQEDQRMLVQMQQNVEAARQSVDQLASQVASQKAELDGQMGELNAAKAKLAVLQKEVASELATQSAANAKLAKNKVALAASIKANGAAMDELGKKIDKLAAAQGGKGRIPSKYSGQLQWPMGGSVSQNFGCTGWFSEPRVGNCAHFHQGIDIVAPCLTPVHAAGDGVIVFIGFNPYDPPPQAWLVIIAHSTEMVTWYAHMTGKAPPGIVLGAEVSAGEVIGTENTTGHSTGCHLHWAVRVNGVFMNPRLFV